MRVEHGGKRAGRHPAATAVHAQLMYGAAESVADGCQCEMRWCGAVGMHQSAAAAGGSSHFLAPGRRRQVAAPALFLSAARCCATSAPSDRRPGAQLQVRFQSRAATATSAVCASAAARTPAACVISARGSANVNLPGGCAAAVSLAGFPRRRRRRPLVPCAGQLTACPAASATLKFLWCAASSLQCHLLKSGVTISHAMAPASRAGACLLAAILLAAALPGKTAGRPTLATTAGLALASSCEAAIG